MTDTTGSTLTYYEHHADDYFRRSVSGDLSHVYARFVEHARPRGRVLDVGCGSGRDAAALKRLGFDVLAIDASAALVQLARAHSGVPCEVLRMEHIAFHREFDAIWACASLLHLSKGALVNVLSRLRQALVENGVLYASVQVGDGERFLDDGRFYSYFEPTEFCRFVADAGFFVAESWLTEDALAGRRSVSWINVLAHDRESD